MVSISTETIENIHPWRVLVVDDVLETAEFYAEQLREHFTDVVIATPERAEGIIKKWNIDALVTDLRFVENRWIDNGLELIQRLNWHCPPTVILTGCVSAKTLSIIIAQAVHSDGTPLLRGVMKWSGINPLVAQIRWAMVDAERLTEWVRAAGIMNIQIPQFNNGEAPSELINLIALLSEKLKNYVRITQEKLAILKEKHGLEDWSSWQAIQATVEWQLEQFATFNSERLIGRSEKDTLDAMHELNSRIILLDMGRLQVPKEHINEEAMGIIRELKNAHAGINAEIKWSFKKAENICHPELDFYHDFERILGRGENHFEISPYRDVEWRSRLRDYGRLITTFLEAIHEQFDDASCSIRIRWIDEEDPWFDGSDEQKKLQNRIDWGGGCRIQITMNNYDGKSNFSGKNNEQILDPIRWILEKLLAAKRIYIDPKSFSYVVDENSGDIEIILKTREIDRAALAKKEAEEAKIQVTKIGAMRVNDYGREEVFRVSTPAGDLTMIGCPLPKKMKNMGENWCVVLHGGELILSSAWAHFENDLAICHYLIKRKKLSSQDAFNIARRTIRLKMQNSCLLADHEKIPEEELQKIKWLWEQMWYEWQYENQEKTIAQLEAITKELWIEWVVLDRGAFYWRSGLEYVMVEDLDDPEMQQFREKEEEEKDEWYDVQE
jgi:CheY-like chemotaxis protein